MANPDAPASLLERLPAVAEPCRRIPRGSDRGGWSTIGCCGSAILPVPTRRSEPLFHLIAYRGLRRGEASGSRWVDRQARTLRTSEQLVQLGWEIETGAPKSDAGERLVTLDETTDLVLENWRRRQIAERLAWGEAWVNSGRIFTHQDGSELHPAEVTKLFNELVDAAGLPPIRLHDLRHGAATLALEAGVDIKVVQELLGHSTSTLTRDTYTSVSPRLARDEAERTASMVPRTTRTESNQRATGTEGFPLVPPPAKLTSVGPSRGERMQITAGAPPGTRTPNPRIKRPLLSISDNVMPDQSVPFLLPSTGPRNDPLPPNAARCHPVLKPSITHRSHQPDL
jgi:hypothetical protein